MWPCDLELWPFDLGHWSYMVGHVAISPPSLTILWLSIFELWRLTSPIGYRRQCICNHCTCTICDLCVGGKFFPHIWNPWPQFAYSVYNFYGATISFTCKGRSQGADLMLKPKIPEYRRNWAQKWQFWGKRGINVRFWFCDPEKTHSSPEPRLLTYSVSISMWASWL